MNILLPLRLLLRLTIVVGVFVAFTSKIQAVSIAEQTQQFNSSLDVWQAIQELGTNLSGKAQTFIFRVSTSASNTNQFDFTAQNSRLYDKTSNTFIVGCVPPNSSPADKLRGLNFATSGVAAGYQDVSIDFSCRNYDFIPGHRYLILISNANMPRWGGLRMKLAAVTSNDYFTNGGLRYAFDSGTCNASQYIWNSQTVSAGCNIFGNPTADLYFVLENNSPPPRLPVIFIPGMGGSEMKAAENIFWADKDNGHGGTYSHAYAGGEKIWVNQDEAVKLGNDDYFDVLRLKPDGQTSEAAISLTGDLTTFGYSEIDSFFTGMGYEKGKNFFTFPYDWRKDIRNTKEDLDSLIETAKQKSGQNKVNLVVHSMGGLVGRYFISDSNKASKVNKLIGLGVPHLGAPSALKALMYGEPIGRWYFKIINIGVNGNEVKDVISNFPSHNSLLPFARYFDFYNNSGENLYPFRDDRDIDSNKITGSLNFDQTKNLLTNLNYNMAVFAFGEQFHNNLDPQLNQTNGTKVYEIVGTSQPTLGQIYETWWITWPVNLIPKTDEIFINGDGTVPLYSASLKNDSLDISGASKIYYVEQEHGNLVSSNGTAMQTVKALLNDDNALPVEVKDQKISLEGDQLSLDDGELDLYDEQNRHCGINDNGELEENIPEVVCTTSGNTKHAFIKKKAKKVKVTITRKKPAVSSKTTNLKKRTYRQDKITRTILYKDISLSQTAKIEFTVDPEIDTSPSLTLYPDPNKSDNTTINPTSEITGSSALDQTPPSTSIQTSGTQDNNGIYEEPVTITLTGTDSESGVLRVEYSLDNGQTVQVYTEPITVSAPGETTVQIKAIDNLGNEEIPQTIIVNIAAQATPAPTPTPSSASNTSTTGGSSSSNSNSSSSSTSNTSEVSSGSNLANTSEVSSTLDSTPGVFKTASELTPGVNITATNTPGESKPTPSVNSSILGISFENPSHISDQINVSKILNPDNNLTIKQSSNFSVTQTLGGLLIVSGGIIALASFGLIITFNPGNLLGSKNLSSFSRRHSSPVKPFPK